MRLDRIECDNGAHKNIIPLDCIQFKGSWNAHKMIDVVDEYFGHMQVYDTVTGYCYEAGACTVYRRSIFDNTHIKVSRD